MALDTLNTSINDGVSQALVAAKQDVADDRFYPSNLGGGKWLLAYAMPSNWFSTAALKNFTELRFSSKTKREDKTSTSHAYTFGASYNAGLWGVKAESQGKFTDERRHMRGDDVEVSCKIAKVSIMRPWFNEFIFRTGNWYTNLKAKSEKGYISSGKVDDSNRGKMLPMYPVAFIVARDVTIKANFSEEDEKHISQAVSASASVSYGPFSIGGSYSYGKKEDNFYASYQGGAIRVPGIQVIGWVSKLVPACPLQSWQELEPSGLPSRA